MSRIKKKSNTAVARPFYKRHWGRNEASYRTRLLHKLQKIRAERPSFWWRERTIWQKLAIIVVSIVMLVTGVMYSVAQWYIFSQRGKQVQLGVTFIPAYARYFELDPQDTLNAMINDAGIRHLRFVSYWNAIEKTPGTYDFAELDWQFRMAERANSKVSLSLGLRQPRWPECHMPKWAASMPKDEWYPHLKTFIKKVVQRYQNSPVLQAYQLENEYFLEVFGDCPDFARERLVDEFKLVKQLDPYHPIVITRSNNAVPSWPIGEPRPDVHGAAVYKRVWDKTLTKRYFEYPLPAWYYAFLAGGAKLTTNRDTILHELQAEPWLAPEFDMRTSSNEEQDKTMNAKRLRDRIEYGKATGMKTIDLWGAEWWYWRKVKRGDPSLWNVAKEAVRDIHDSSSNYGR